MRELNNPEIFTLNMPEFYRLVATGDQMIPPPSQRQTALRANAQAVQTCGSYSV